MKTRALSKSCSCLTPLYRGALFAVDDWQCAGHDSPGLHEEWCADDRIVITRRGVWELQSSGHRQIADPLHAIFWNGQTSFRVRHPIGGGDVCTVLRLTPSGSSALRALHNPTSENQLALTFKRASHLLSPRSFLLHWRVLQAARLSDHFDRLAIDEAALELLMDVSTVPTLTSVPPNISPAYVHHAREVIAKRHTEALCLADIANTVACSPFHLARQFKRAFGISLHQTLMAWRLRVGLERVLDQPEQLTTIALDLGFASHSHFSDAFRKHYGCSPQQARQRTLSPHV
jgi:AraC family transcriptional regulator